MDLLNFLQTASKTHKIWWKQGKDLIEGSSNSIPGTLPVNSETPLVDSETHVYVNVKYLQGVTLLKSVRQYTVKEKKYHEVIIPDLFLDLFKKETLFFSVFWGEEI